MDHQAYFHYQPPALDSPNASPTAVNAKPRPGSSSSSAGNPSSYPRPGSSSASGANIRNYSYDGGLRQSEDAGPASAGSSSLLPPLYENQLSSASSGPNHVSPTTAFSHAHTVRNTRPMTAPGSVSTPYYGATASDHFGQFQLQSPNGGLAQQNEASSIFQHAPTTTATSLSTFSSASPGTIPSYPTAHSAMEAHMLRNSRMSLPELPGLPPSALPDEPHSYSGQFAHMPPPQRYFASGSTPLSYSRPTTADSRPNTTGSILSTGMGDKLYSFVALPGTPKKRPRRRYDEIERMYGCNYPGCTKAYGTLNHLNAHITMQKHGPKRVPSEFKEARKEWRARKKQQDEARQAQAKASSLANGGHAGYVLPGGAFLAAYPKPPTAVPMNAYGELRPQTAPAPQAAFYHHGLITDPTPPGTASREQLVAFGAPQHPHASHPAHMPHMQQHMMHPMDGPRRMSLPAGASIPPRVMEEDEMRAKTSAGPPGTQPSTWGSPVTAAQPVAAENGYSS